MTLPVTGHTTVAGILGEPVAHSRSPAIHNAAYAALGLDWVYVAFPVHPGAVAAALDGLRALGVAGCNVTMPHKHEAALACDTLEVTAAAIGAVNTVWVRDGRLVGDSTDGPGFVDAARAAGVELDRARVLVLGAGGAARAIVHALGPLATVDVWSRRLDAAATTAALAATGDPIPSERLDDTVAASDVIVNATPLGMGGEAPPFDTGRLHPAQTVIDAVVAPPDTPLLAAAARRGATTVTGLGMLVHQAARAFTLLTGREAPLDTMWAAARDLP
ncbi:MAG TPA: shikimate dehydrogenase [Acidimicrobiia bacterium]|nr:shikimate dehydrogenase [Acidimicrobiia bacterium]